MIKLKGDEHVKSQTLETVSHPNSMTKSFKVGIKYDDKDKVLGEHIWPQGIGCRIWRTKQVQNACWTVPRATS